MPVTQTLCERAAICILQLNACLETRNTFCGTWYLPYISTSTMNELFL